MLPAIKAEVSSQATTPMTCLPSNETQLSCLPRGGLSHGNAHISQLRPLKGLLTDFCEEFNVRGLLAYLSEASKI